MQNITKIIIKHLINIVLFVTLVPTCVFAASLSMSVSNTNISVGDTISLRVVVSGGSDPLNAISGDISIPTSLFSIESVLKTNSVLNFWVTEPVFSNQTGLGHFEGVSLTGYTGNGGTVITYILKANQEGSGNISFRNGQILANDGQGTDITKGLTGVNINIGPAKIIKKKPIEAKPLEIKPEVILDDIQIAPTLLAPEIYLSKKYGEKAIVGKSDYPVAQVLITFVAPDGSKLFINSKTDETGEFVALIPNSLKRGDYHVTVIMVKNDGTNSPASERIIVRVGSIFSDVGIEFYITIGLLVLFIGYLLVRLMSRYRKGLPLVIRREIKEAEDVLKKSFNILKDDIRKVEKDFSKTKLKEEDFSDLKQDIDEAEDVIDKEIRDINSV